MFKICSIYVHSLVSLLILPLPLAPFFSTVLYLVLTRQEGGTALNDQKEFYRAKEMGSMCSLCWQDNKPSICLAPDGTETLHHI